MNIDILKKIFLLLCVEGEKITLDEPQIAVRVLSFPRSIAPFPFPKNYRCQQEIELLEDLYERMGHPALSEVDKKRMSEGGHHGVAMTFRFKAKRPAYDVVFTLFLDNDDNPHFLITYGMAMGTNYYNILNSSRPFNPENCSAEEKKYFKQMLKLAETVYRELQNPTPKENRQLKLKNLKKIFQYFQTSDSWNFSLEKPFAEVCYWEFPQQLAPDDIPEDYSFEKEIALLDEMMIKAGFAPFSDEEIEGLKKGNFYDALSIHFTLKVKDDEINLTHLSFTVFQRNDGNLCLIYHSYFQFPKYINIFEDSGPFDLEHLEDTQPVYFDGLVKVCERFCDALEIETEENQGIFPETKQESGDKQTDFAEFLSLIDFKNRLTEAEKASLMEDSQLIHDNPRKFAEKFVANSEHLEEDAVSEFESEPKWMLYYFSLSQFENIHIYNDDWKFDNEGLSEFISEETGLEFAYTDDDIRIEAVAEELEQQSDYSLINLDSGGDDCNFLVIKKADKERILALAHALGIPIS